MSSTTAEPKEWEPKTCEWRGINESYQIETRIDPRSQTIYFLVAFHNDRDLRIALSPLMAVRLRRDLKTALEDATAESLP